MLARPDFVAAPAGPVARASTPVLRLRCGDDTGRHVAAATPLRGEASSNPSWGPAGRRRPEAGRMRGLSRARVEGSPRGGRPRLPACGPRVKESASKHAPVVSRAREGPAGEGTCCPLDAPYYARAREEQRVLRPRRLPNNPLPASGFSLPTGRYA